MAYRTTSGKLYNRGYTQQIYGKKYVMIIISGMIRWEVYTLLNHADGMEGMQNCLKYLKRGRTVQLFECKRDCRYNRMQ